MFTCTQTPEQVVALLKIKNVKPRVSIAPDRLSVDVYFGKEKSTLKLEAPVASFRLDVSPQNVTVTLRKDKDALWSTLPGPPPQSKQKTPPLPNSTVPAPSPPGPPVEGHSPQTSASAASRGYDPDSSAIPPVPTGTHEGGASVETKKIGGRKSVKFDPMQKKPAGADSGGQTSEAATKSPTDAVELGELAAAQAALRELDRQSDAASERWQMARARSAPLVEALQSAEERVAELEAALEAAQVQRDRALEASRALVLEEEAARRQAEALEGQWVAAVARVGRARRGGSSPSAVPSTTQTISVTSNAPTDVFINKSAAPPAPMSAPATFVATPMQPPEAGTAQRQGGHDEWAQDEGEGESDQDEGSTPDGTATKKKKKRGTKKSGAQKRKAKVEVGAAGGADPAAPAPLQPSSAHAEPSAPVLKANTAASCGASGQKLQRRVMIEEIDSTDSDDDPTPSPAPAQSLTPTPTATVRRVPIVEIDSSDDDL